MKKGIAMSMVLLAVLVFSSAVYAWWGDYGSGYRTSVNVETMKKFQKETITLRDELVTKEIELEDEYDKPVHDTKRIASLKKEIIDLQAKVQLAAEKYGLRTGATTGHNPGRHRMAGRGMMAGDGMMGGCGCRY